MFSKCISARVEADVLELRRRYTNLYVPSDFFFTEIRWSESFPPNATFSIQKPCAFHIAHRSVEAPDSTTADDGASAADRDALLDAPDADYLFSAKVGFGMVKLFLLLKNTD